MKDCKYYCKDYQLEGVCKKHSDWSEAMPVIEYCLLGPCGDYEFDFDCKWYKDDFCVNADSPCVADWCPCAQYPDLCKYYKGTQSSAPTYEELYECKCGCRFVALHPRHLDDEVRVHRVEHEEKFCLSTQY